MVDSTSSFSEGVDHAEEKKGQKDIDQKMEKKRMCRPHHTWGWIGDSDEKVASQHSPLHHADATCGQRQSGQGDRLLAQAAGIPDFPVHGSCLPEPRKLLVNGWAHLCSDMVDGPAKSRWTRFGNVRDRVCGCANRSCRFLQRQATGTDSSPGKPLVPLSAAGRRTA